MKMISERIDDVVDDEQLLDQFVNNQIMKWMCSGLNFDTTYTVNRRKDKIMRI